MNLKAAGLPCRTLSTTYVITTAEVYQVGDGLGASHGCMHGRYPRCRGSRLSGPAHIADSASSGVQFAGPRSTAAKCSNAIGFDRASSCSNAQIRAQTHAVDRHAPSSQLGVRVRVSSPQKRLVSWPGSATGVVIIYCYQYYHSMDAATLIRMTRESAGLSQGALAARAGTSQPAVSRYESGSSCRSRVGRTGPTPTLISWSTSMSGPGVCSLWPGCRTSWLRCWGRGSKSSPRTRSLRTSLRTPSPRRCSCEPLGPRAPSRHLGAHRSERPRRGDRGALSRRSRCRENSARRRPGPRLHDRGGPVKGLSLGLRQRYPDVPWSDMARMRDLIGHHYYKLDPQIVRATIGAPVERLRAACKAILAEPVGEAEDNE